MSAVAVLKIGSTTTSLLIAKNLSSPLAVEQHVINLFDPDAELQLDKTVGYFTQMVERLSCHKRLAAGGQALRQFPNLRNSLDSRGWPLWIPDGPWEGRLSWFAVKAQEPDMDWLIDIGGGSTELASASRTVSLPIGAAAPNMNIDWPQDIHAEAPYAVGGTAHAIRILTGDPIITLDTVKRIQHEITEHPKWLDSMDLVRRQVFPQGLAVVRAVMEHYQWQELRYSSQGFLQGIWLTASLGRDGVGAGGIDE